jgi:hypothetical protein
MGEKKWSWMPLSSMKTDWRCVESWKERKIEP